MITRYEMILGLRKSSDAPRLRPLPPLRNKFINYVQHERTYHFMRGVNLSTIWVSPERYYSVMYEMLERKNSLLNMFPPVRPVQVPPFLNMFGVFVMMDETLRGDEAKGVFLK